MGNTISLQTTMTFEELAKAAESAQLHAVVAKVIREEQIDAALALELESDDLKNMTTRSLDQKRLKTALGNL